MQINAHTYTVLHDIIDYLGLFLDAGLIVFLVNNYFSPRLIFPHRPLFLAGSFVCVSGFIYCMGFSKSFFLFTASIFLSVLLYSMLCFRGHFYMKLSIACIFCSVYFIMDSSYLSLYRYFTSLNAPSVSASGLFVFFFQRIICKLLMYFIIRFLLKNGFEPETSIPKPYAACLFISCGFDLSLLLLNTFYFAPDAASKSSLLIPPFMLVCMCMILSFFYLSMSMLHSYRENIGYQLQMKEWELHQQYLEQAHEFVTASRQFRHDVKAHLFCMEGLLEQGSYQELKDYLQQFASSEFLTLPIHSFCPDDTINTLLSQKLKRASDARVPLSIDINISNHFTIQKIDLCTILSNLCDNAIEASTTVPSPQVSIEMKEIKGYLSILVKNKTVGNTLRGNPSLSTSKADSSLHGHGLTIVRNIARKYNGSVDITCGDNTFTCFVLLENLPFTI